MYTIIVFGLNNSTVWEVPAVKEEEAEAYILCYKARSQPFPPVPSTDRVHHLYQAFNRSSHPEDVTGLTELHKLTEAAELWDQDYHEMISEGYYLNVIISVLSVLGW